jgi:hypothetical protein
MPFCKSFEALYSMKVRGRVGRPNSCGESWCGWSQCGEENLLSAVYQQRRKRIGNNHNWRIGDPKPRNFRMRHTWPPQNNTPAKIASMNNFANAVAAWQALTKEQKAYYNEIALKRRRHGYNFFISQFLKSI